MNSSLPTVAKWSFWLGAFLVVATHIYMLTMGLPVEQMVPHAIINLVAGALIIFAWMKR